MYVKDHHCQLKVDKTYDLNTHNYKLQNSSTMIAMEFEKYLPDYFTKLLSQQPLYIKTLMLSRLFTSSQKFLFILKIANFCENIEPSEFQIILNRQMLYFLR